MDNVHSLFYDATSRMAHECQLAKQIKISGSATTVDFFGFQFISPLFAELWTNSLSMK